MSTTTPKTRTITLTGRPPVRIDEDDMEWELLPIDGDTYGIFAVDADEDADPIRTAQGDEIDELEREVAEHNAGLAEKHRPITRELKGD